MASKSLGTLTLDLVARTAGFVQGMSEAERSSEKWRKQVKADAEQIGKVLGVASAAAATALIGMTASAVHAAEDISRFSAAAGTGVEEFQRYAAGAKMVGVEQDKLSDIFKDTNDKVGEFLSTGGGELKDFFEQIAPKVGVTAEQFHNLSGPQALQLFASSLEKANLSQAQMTFYMEGIADEASALLPLLRDNGEGFRVLGEHAEQVGAIMDADTIRAANELSAASMFMDQAMQGASNQIMSALLPSLSGVAAGLLEASGDGQGFAIVGEAVSVVLETAAATAVGAYSAIQLFGKSLAGVAFIASAVPDGLDAVKEASRIVGEELDATAQKSANALDQIVNGPAKQGKVSAVADMIEGARKAAVGATAAITHVSDESAKAAQKQAEAIAGQIESLQQQAAMVGMSADQQTLYKLALDGATESQLAQARAALDSVAAFEQQQKKAEQYRALVASLRTEDEQRLDTMREQLAVLDAMKGISGSERAGVAGRIAGAATSDAPEFDGIAPEVGGAFGELAKIDAAEEKLAEWYSTQLAQLETFRQERADLTATWDAEELALKQEHETELSKIEQARQSAQLAAAASVFENLAGMTASFAGEQSAAYKVMFAASKAFALADSMVQIQAAVAKAANLPFPANIPAMATVASLGAGIVANIGAIGMAHDGIDSVPQTGTWLLEKGERVTTAETSAKLDKTLSDIQGGGAGGVTVNLNEDASRAGSTQMRNLDGKQILDVFVSNIRADGQASKAIQSAFGVRRAGR